MIVCFLRTIRSQDKIYSLSLQYDIWAIGFYGCTVVCIITYSLSYNTLLKGGTEQLT